VLEGRLPSFGFEYPCHSPDQQRWYSMTVTPLHAEGEGAVITHTDITASKLAQDAIRSARDEAERANRAKSEFLSRMSHELRTPLNAILGFGQLLERANLVALQTDNVREILHAGRHLLELINEVLDLARIESGKFSVSLEAVPLLPLIADCLSLMRPQAESAGIELIETAQDCGEQVRADRTRLKQVLLNLLSNAVKYNRPQGAINVTPTLQEDAVQIRIRDTGAGLTAEQQARLFVPFERLDADQSAIEGTGIGLALSKRLVELMGGSIGVESEPGVGSTFWLTLPLADAAAEASDSVVPASAAPAPQAVAERQFDILCIEDNPANLRLVERILAQRADIRLLSASAPGLGLELAAAHRPSLILLDINLPDMDGYEVLRRLQANPATCSIPVLGISSNAMPKDIERALAAGFSDYLTKPLDIAQFMAVVYSYLEAPS
jgi:signal transduction histidine kinase/ActR/RegA family two-component response regulator